MFLDRYGILTGVSTRKEYGMKRIGMTILAVLLAVTCSANVEVQKKAKLKAAAYKSPAVQKTVKQRFVRTLNCNAETWICIC